MSSFKGSVVFPSLSGDGYVEDRNVLMSKLFEMFLASDESQSNYTQSQSLKGILNSETVDEYSRREDIRKALVILYEPYYDTVEVSVNIETTENNMSVYDVSIDTVYNGEDYALNQNISNDYYTNINKFDYMLGNLEN